LFQGGKELGMQGRQLKEVIQIGNAKRIIQTKSVIKFYRPCLIVLQHEIKLALRFSKLLALPLGSTKSECTWANSTPLDRYNVAQLLVYLNYASKIFSVYISYNFI
jgi:hypothetical protein